MKICFLIKTIFDLGGVQRVVSIVANKLSEKHEVSILCTEGDIEINRDLYNLSPKIKVTIKPELMGKNNISRLRRKYFGKLNRLTGILNNNIFKDFLAESYYPIEVRQKLVEYLNVQNYDIVIGVEGIYALLLGMIKADINSKVIGWQHNSYDAYLNNKDKYYWNQDEVFKKYIPRLDEYVVLTNADKAMYKEKMDIDSTVIYNPLSFESKEKSFCTEKRIVFVGRLIEEQKGLDLLIEAFKIVNEYNKEWTLTIVGDGPDKDKLLNNIKVNRLQGYVDLVGQSDNVIQYYLNSSIFLSTSRWEGFGLVITEAMECGLPVISFNNSGPREIIDNPNINGILINNHDAKKLASEIIKLIDDEDKRKTLSLNSIERAAEFNINHIVKQWDEILG